MSMVDVSGVVLDPAAGLVQLRGDFPQGGNPAIAALSTAGSAAQRAASSAVILPTTTLGCQ